ncbi:hypothetical protein GOV12_00500 [Candidatus Pacearchaeota archaeon]|nr:hypothetical protein [Candidatus Pacearchaeota archaeon]
METFINKDILGYPGTVIKMISIDSTTAKKLVLKSNYKSIYTEKVKTNGGNSAKINCKKEYINNEVVVFVLGKEDERKIKKGVENAS